MHCGIRLNGRPLPAPDELRLVWEGGSGAAQACRLSASIRWAWLDGEDARLALTAAGGECTMTVFDPSIGRENTVQARLVKAEAGCMPECCRDVRVILSEVRHDK